MTHFAAKIIEYLRNIRLSYRLAVSFLLISLIPCIGLAVSSFNVYSDSLSQKLTQSVSQSNELLNHNLTLILGDYSRYISECSVNASVQYALRDKYPQSSLSGPGPLSIGLESTVALPYLRETVIVGTDGSIVYSTGHVIVNEESILPITGATDISSPKDHLCYYSAPYGNDSLALCRKIYDSSSLNNAAGYIVLLINPRIFDSRTFPVSSLGEGACMFLVNSDGDVISSQNPTVTDDADIMSSCLYAVFSKEPYRETDNVVDIAGEPYHIVYTFNNTYDLYMVSIIPGRNITGEIAQVRNVIFVITLILIFVCLLLAFIIYKSLSIPIGKMVSSCLSSKGGKHHIPIGDPAPDELGYLSRTIDTMAYNNEKMVEDIREKDREARELELEMLRYQINPHFLFNTLNTFKWIASANGVDTLSSGISSLAALLRNMLVNKNEMITLTDEIKSIRNYCTIQDLRFMGQFDISYDIGDYAADCLIPRLLLQPLVENAIVHGQRTDGTPLHINITCTVSSGLLNISVCDSGAGFDVGAVRLSDGSGFKGIGLSNVDKRLRLRYGNANGLEIKSCPGEGTECRISVPVLKEQK